MHTPKRPLALPEVLNRGEVRSVLAAADTLRDQLLIGLLYGCGLKPGELAALRWKHILLAEKRLWVVGSLNTGARHLPIPADLVPLLTEGVSACRPEDYIFAGARHGRPLTRAMVERIVRRCALLAGVSKPVTAMSFRHSYAVHNLEAGMSIRELQGNLGQYRLQTTMRYRRCLVPAGAASPIDVLPQPGADAATARHQQEPHGSSSGPDTVDRSGSLPPCRTDADGAMFVSAPTTLPLAFPFKPEGAEGRGIREFPDLLRRILAGRFLAARRYFGSG